jgi:hypothetical protein
VPDRRLVDGVSAPVRAGRLVAGTDGQHQARAVAGTDENMGRPEGAVNEVPLAQAALLSLDHQQRLARQHEEVLLVVLPVVHGHRLAGPEQGEVDAELLEIGSALEAGTLELAEDAAALALPPLCVARVEDEPPLPLGDEAVLGLHELRLRGHRWIR